MLIHKSSPPTLGVFFFTEQKQKAITIRYVYKSGLITETAPHKPNYDSHDAFSCVNPIKQNRWGGVSMQKVLSSYIFVCHSQSLWPIWCTLCTCLCISKCNLSKVTWTESHKSQITLKTTNIQDYENFICPDFRTYVFNTRINFFVFFLVTYKCCDTICNGGFTLPEKDYVSVLVNVKWPHPKCRHVRIPV